MRKRRGEGITAERLPGKDEIFAIPPGPRAAGPHSICMEMSLSLSSSLSVEETRGREGWRRKGRRAKKTTDCQGYCDSCQCIRTGRGPGGSSAAHMDKINLCVYDGLIHAAGARGAMFARCKNPLSVIDRFPSTFASSLPVSVGAVLHGGATAGSALILRRLSAR